MFEKHIKIENYPLTWTDKKKLHQNEFKVIYCYEKATGNRFMSEDLITLKELIRVATPEQINSQIMRFSKGKYKDNFVDFFYIAKPVRQMFNNRRGGSKA